MPKPLTLAKTRPLLGSLFRKDKVTLIQKGTVFAAYFNEDLEPRFWGNSWEEVLETAQLSRFEEKYNL